MESNNTTLNKVGVEYILSLLRILLLSTFMYFIFAQGNNILRSIIYFVLCFANFGTDVYFFIKKVPLLANKRGENKEYKETWEKPIDIVLTVANYSIFIIAGFESYFFHTTFGGIFTLIIGILLFVSGNILLKWSMHSNQYFTSNIEIEVNSIAVTDGPYKYIRHPGYLAFCQIYLSTPLILGSFLALIPSLILIMTFIVLIFLEDQLLQTKLKGYSQYKKDVPYKFIPKIW